MTYELNDQYLPIRKYLTGSGGIDDYEGHLEYSEITDWPHIFFPDYNQPWYSHMKDQVGTIYKVHSMKTRSIEDIRTYNAFGNLISQTGTTKTPLGFQGKYYDAESGLNYFYHRYYNPAIGRFTTEDSIMVKRGLNLFEFFRNNALNLMDPLGLYWEYCQANGRLYYNNITTGQRTFTGTGYSGCGEGLNNPFMQNVGDVGPIPQRYWIIGPMRNSIRTGPHALIYSQNLKLIYLEEIAVFKYMGIIHVMIKVLQEDVSF